MEDLFVLGDRVGDAEPRASEICHGPGPPVQEVPARLATTRIFETFSANQGKKTLQRRLRTATAIAVLAQEIGYGAGDSGALS
eukprot:3512758-Pyramimonas_sp.AAC.1